MSDTTITIPLRMAKTIRLAFLPNSPNKMRNAAPETVQAAKDFIDAVENHQRLAAQPDVWTRRPATGWTAKTLPELRDKERARWIIVFDGSESRPVRWGKYSSVTQMVGIVAWMYVPDYADLGAAVARGTEE